MVGWFHVVYKQGSENSDAAAHQGTGPTDVTITVADNFYGASPGIDKVTVAIPRSLAVGGKLMARLKVVVTP